MFRVAWRKHAPRVQQFLSKGSKLWLYDGAALEEWSLPEGRVVWSWRIPPALKEGVHLFLSVDALIAVCADHREFWAAAVRRETGEPLWLRTDPLPAGQSGPTIVLLENDLIFPGEHELEVVCATTGNVRARLPLPKPGLVQNLGRRDDLLYVEVWEERPATYALSLATGDVVFRQEVMGRASFFQGMIVTPHGFVSRGASDAMALRDLRTGDVRAEFPFRLPEAQYRLPVGDRLLFSGTHRDGRRGLWRLDWGSGEARHVDPDGPNELWETDGHLICKVIGQPTRVWDIEALRRSQTWTGWHDRASGRVFQAREPGTNHRYLVYVEPGDGGDVLALLPDPPRVKRTRVPRLTVTEFRPRGIVGWFREEMLVWRNGELLRTPLEGGDSTRVCSFGTEAFPLALDPERETVLIAQITPESAARRERDHGRLTDGVTDVVDALRRMIEHGLGGSYEYNVCVSDFSGCTSAIQTIGHPLGAWRVPGTGDFVIQTHEGLLSTAPGARRIPVEKLNLLHVDAAGGVPMVSWSGAGARDSGVFRLDFESGQAKREWGGDLQALATFSKISSRRILLQGGALYDSAVDESGFDLAPTVVAGRPASRICGPAHFSPQTDVAVFPVGSPQRMQSLVLCDLADRRVLGSAPAAISSPVEIRWSPDGRRLAVWNDDRCFIVEAP